MFFRFCCTVLLVVLVSLIGVALEERGLDLRRRVSRQHYRIEALQEVRAELRLRVQRLGAPPRLWESAVRAHRRNRQSRAGRSRTPNRLGQSPPVHQ